MLDILEYVDARMLPNATAFVIVLKTIVRVSADCSSPVNPADVVNLERNTDAQ